MSEVKGLVERRLEVITPEFWGNCVKHVKSIENNYWKSDIAVDEVIESVVINLAETDSDSTDTAAEDGHISDYSTVSGGDTTDSINKSTDTADEIFSVVSLKC